MNLIKKIFIPLVIVLCYLDANANTIIASNLSKKETNNLINKITEMYQIGFDVLQNPENVKKFLAKNYVLYSNSQKQNRSQLISHLYYLHQNYLKINLKPFELIQITDNFMTLKYQVFLISNKKTEGFNFIAIYHFKHNKIDRTWEVASPISSKNIS